MTEPITLTFAFAKGTPPADVLIEHLAYHIRNDLQETELTTVRNHPFEGPEMFDDYIQTEEFVAPEHTDGGVKLDSPWPHVDGAIRGLRNSR